jgi:hypothetical protein
MKQSAKDDAIERSMAPGVLTGSGMLGDDRRKLTEILDADHAAVQRLGVTHAAIAARMRELRDAGARGLGQAIRVLERFEVRVDSARGTLPCPFRHEGMYAKEFVEVRNLASGEQVTFSELNLHMIEAHGFYEGVGAPFRQDPATLVRVLEIGK